jgi:hypothetical protein
MTFEIRGIKYTIESNNMQLAEAYYSHSIDDGGRLTWGCTVTELMNNVGTNSTHKFLELLGDGTTILVEGCGCQTCGNPIKVRDKALSRSALMQHRHYYHCQSCQTKHEAKSGKPR